MKIKTFTIDENTTLPAPLEKCIPLNSFCILDIETTGLSKNYHQVILVGILYNQGNHTIIKQFFAEETREESILLEKLHDELKRFNYLITYNGSSFDCPFLIERFKQYHLLWNNDIQHIDILQYLRKYRKYLAVDNLKLKTIENFLGIERKDTISGKDSVLLYKKYIETKSPGFEKTILLHNYEDVYYLSKILHIFDHLPVNELSFNKYDIHVDCMSNLIHFWYYGNELSIKNNFLQLKGKTTQINSIPDKIHYTHHYNFKWSPREGLFEIEISLKSGTLSSGSQCTYLIISDFGLSTENFSSEVRENYILNDQFLITSIGSNLNIAPAANIIESIINNAFGKKGAGA